MEALQKSKVNGKYYLVSSLSLDEKVRLGFNKEVVSELKKVNSEQKKSHARKPKKEDNE